MKPLDVRLLQLIHGNMKQQRVITMEEFNKNGLAILNNLPNFLIYV